MVSQALLRLQIVHPVTFPIALRTTAMTAFHQFSEAAEASSASSALPWLTSTTPWLSSTLPSFTTSLFYPDLSEALPISEAQSVSVFAHLSYHQMHGSCSCTKLNQQSAAM